MTIQEIHELYAYNAWANNKIFDLVAQLKPEQYMQDLKSSHGGIHGTLTHMIGAEKVWLQRWQKDPNNVFIKAAEFPSFDALRALWNTVNEERGKFLAAMTDESLNDTITVTTLKGDVFVNSFSQMMQHMINHSTYHRGQVVSMLRQLGSNAVSTDLIGYYRK